MKNGLKHYSKRDLWILFLMCAFPLHVWVFLLSFRDISWLSARTNLWDAVGVMSYGMVFAFVESVLVFLVAALLGLFVSTKWGSQKRTTLVSSLVVVIALWSVLSQLYFMLGWSLPAGLIDFLVRSGHPVRIFSATLLALVIFSVVLPTYVIIRSERAYAAINEIMDRISVLTTVYLIVDGLAFCIVLVRNI